MSEDQNSVVTLKVRVSPEFREKIVETAKNNNRSMNQEIVSRLEDSFPATTNQEAYKRYINKRINNLAYTIERLELQIINASFIVNMSNQDDEKIKKWATIKEFMILEKDTTIEILKKLFTDDYENINLRTLDEETNELLHKYLDIKKAP